MTSGQLPDGWAKQATVTGGTAQITIPASGDLAHVLTDVYAQLYTQPWSTVLLSSVNGGQATVTQAAIAGVAHIVTHIQAEIASSVANAFSSYVEVSLDGGTTWQRLGSLMVPAAADSKDSYAFDGQLIGVAGDAVTARIHDASGAGATEHIEVVGFDTAALSPPPAIQYSLDGGNSFTKLGSLSPLPGKDEYTFSAQIGAQSGKSLIVGFTAAGAPNQTQHLEVKGTSV